jgi:hypothetical protein
MWLRRADCLGKTKSSRMRALDAMRKARLPLAPVLCYIPHAAYVRYLEEGSADFLKVELKRTKSKCLGLSCRFFFDGLDIRGAPYWIGLKPAEIPESAEKAWDWGRKKAAEQNVREAELGLLLTDFYRAERGGVARVEPGKTVIETCYGDPYVLLRGLEPGFDLYLFERGKLSLRRIGRKTTKAGLRGKGYALSRASKEIADRAAFSDQEMKRVAGLLQRVREKVFEAGFLIDTKGRLCFFSV